MKCLSRVPELLAWIWLAMLLLGGSRYVATAQTPATTEFSYVLRDVIVTPPNKIEFDILVKNTSQARQRWANGMMSVSVDGVSLRNAVFVLDSTALPAEGIATMPPLLRRGGYSFQTRMNADRSECSIAVIGPDEVQNCVALNPSDSVLVARGRITLAQALAAPELAKPAWTLPLEGKQLSAFKTDIDVTVGGIRYNANDNITRSAGVETTRSEVFQTPQFALAAFTAQYQGDKRIALSWRGQVGVGGIRPSALNVGFIVRRGVRPAGELDNAGVRFTDTIARYDRPGASNTGLRITQANPQAAYSLTDSAVNRNETYVYELIFQDASQIAGSTVRTISQGVADATTRNAVISSAQIAPNPASDQTTLVYRVEDRVRLTATVYDLEGKLIATLIQNEEKPRGDYRLTVDVRSFGSGSKIVLLRAVPVGDTGITASQAMFKMQVIK